ncbi:hypothetical protein [Pseudomonas sp. NBRC 111131]|uniref:hypothetical protein n=1 Tax=Pseudomonas sp. NBRC 111131 TaxID=1661046 RepID=UPI0006D3AA78|nr:hypothetical protein [Pseudomonas sp. NBRC 111131]
MNNLIQSEILHKKHSNPTILYITNNFSQVELALLSVAESKYDFLIYNNVTHKEYNLATDYLLPKNVKVTSDPKSVIMLSGIFSAAITTVGHISPVLNAKIVSILKACVAINLPIIEVPHGLYQWGFNLSDDSKFINTASNTLGAGYPVPSFADHQISWFDDNSIGYPRYRSESVKKKYDVVVPKYTVITTNTNWYLYNYNDQRVLAQALFELARANPEEMFIWSPHSAELNAHNLINNMLGAKPANLFRYGYDKDIYFHSIDTTEDLISHAAAGITTVSTCLLEYEIHKIPTAIFSTNSLQTVTSSMLDGAFFATPDDLKSLDFKPPITGQLHRYDVEGFDSRLSQILISPKKNNPIKNSILYL